MRQLNETTIIGRGPAGLLAASLIARRDEKCLIVSDNQGSLGLWSANFDFYSPQNTIRDPWGYIESFPIKISRTQWSNLWSIFSSILKDAKVELNPIPEHNLWTITCTGKPKSVFMVPKWQYVSPHLSEVIFIGFEGLADSMAALQCENYKNLTGSNSSYYQIPKPSQYSNSWGSLRWASYFDTDEAMKWLIPHLRKAVGGLDTTWPVLLPQVLGRRFVEKNLRLLRKVLRRPVFEYPLLSPSIGGLRVQDRWEWSLRQQGVGFLTGKVTGIAPGGLISLNDGRSWKTDRIITATGGVLGGGVEIDPYGKAYDSTNPTKTGLVKIEKDIQIQWESSPLEDLVITAGAQCINWNPNRDSNGGAMILATVAKGLGMTKGSRQNNEF